MKENSCSQAKARVFLVKEMSPPPLFSQRLVVSSSWFVPAVHMKPRRRNKR
jgi:hypothetical protein